MNYNPTTPGPSPMSPGNIVTPQGWKVEWSAQYGRYFYINVNTNESTWTLPVSIPAQQFVQPPQRKPVPTPTSAAPAQSSAACIESYPTPPLQVSTGYFPPAPALQQQPQPQHAQPPMAHQQQQQSQPHSVQSPMAIQHQQIPQQNYPQFPQQQKLHSNQPQGVLQQQYSPVPQQQSPASFQQQHRNYTPPSATPTSASPQYFQPPPQTFSPPLTPNTQQPTNYVPSPYNNPQTNVHQPAQFSPQQQKPPIYYPQQQQNNYAIQPQSQQTKRSSMMGGSLMNNTMMTKMSSKFTSLQKGTTGPPTAAHPSGKPADWKKWGKRAAIGVAGIGALAIGVDAAGDMFSGAEGMFGDGGDLAGGGDFTGGGEVMDAQTAVDANYMENAMAGMGQENALMLTDPVGTTYTPLGDAAATQDAAGLIG